MKKSFWQKSTSSRSFPALDRSLTVDALIVGGGLTGLTAARLIQMSGGSVALLERGNIGQIDTAHTTAHLTHVIDKRLNDLINNFGDDVARLVWDAGRTAIQQIEQIVRDDSIDCELQRVPGFLHAADAGDSVEERRLRKEAGDAERLGFDAAFTQSVPFFAAPGVLFPNQAKLHPLKYVYGLAEAVRRNGGMIFENSEAGEFKEKPIRVISNGHEITCGKVIIATHAPLTGLSSLVAATLFQTKLALYTSYAISGVVADRQHSEALFWDTADPYRYLRIDRRGNDAYLVYGGGDHKTGQGEGGYTPGSAGSGEPFSLLEQKLQARFPAVKIDSRWSGQVIETHDGLPYIGAASDDQFLCTGYSGNGWTFGTLAGMMARDFCSGSKNPWQKVFDPARKKIKAGLKDFAFENIDYPYYMARDRLFLAEREPVDSVKPGEGKILRVEGRRVAVYRNHAGEVIRLSPVCTHLGCLVRWNGADSTWDCPCHGSRFSPDGKVLGGPAETPLEELRSTRRLTEDSEVASRIWSSRSIHRAWCSVVERSH